VRDPYDRPDC